MLNSNPSQALSLDNIRTVADEVIESGFENLLKFIHCDSAAIWLKNPAEDKLTIAFNVGGRGKELEGQVSQSLDSGLVSKAYREQQMICHQGIFNHKEQSSQIDMELGQMTAHQIAAPFKLFGQLVGAVTAVQIISSEKPRTSGWGFDDEMCHRFTNWVQVAERLFELNLLKAQAKS